MTTFATNQPILVTGVTGYVAAWIVLELLRKGYKVRGTSRSQEKFNDLCIGHEEFSKAVAESRFTNEIIEDVASSNFDEAMKGVEIVLHTASPFHFKGGDAETTYLLPALNGTLNVLKAAHRSGTVKKFVITSSFAAIFSLGENDNLPLNGKTYTELDWNSATFESSKDCQDPAYNYCASKKIAEKAAYDYVCEHQLENKIQLSSINPPLIFGPWIHSVKRLDQLNESVGQVYEMITGKNGADQTIPPTHFPVLIDVRDVAKAHILAMEKDVKGRFLIGGGSYDNEWICDLAQTNFAEFYKGPKVTQEDVKKGISNDKNVFKLDCSKAKQQLGMDFIDRKKTILDMISQMANFVEQEQ